MKFSLLISINLKQPTRNRHVVKILRDLAVQVEKGQVKDPHATGLVNYFPIFRNGREIGRAGYIPDPVSSRHLGTAH